MLLIINVPLFIPEFFPNNPPAEKIIPIIDNVFIIFPVFIQPLNTHLPLILTDRCQHKTPDEGPNRSHSFLQFINSNFSFSS